MRVFLTRNNLRAATSLSVSSFTFIPFFQLRQGQNDPSEQANVNYNNTALKTYVNQGFGITIRYPYSWFVTQHSADPFAPINLSIVALSKALVESKSDLYQ